MMTMMMEGFTTRGISAPVASSQAVLSSVGRLSGGRGWGVAVGVAEGVALYDT